MWVWWGYAFGGTEHLSASSQGTTKANGVMAPPLLPEEMSTIVRPSSTEFKIRMLKKGSVGFYSNDVAPLLQASALSRYFIVQIEVYVDANDASDILITIEFSFKIFLLASMKEI